MNNEQAFYSFQNVTAVTSSVPTGNPSQKQATHSGASDPSRVPAQERIWWRDIEALGFQVQEDHDTVFIAQYGFPYWIVTKKLTSRIYLDWERETGLCELIRANKECDIKAKMPVRDLSHLKEIIAFFCGDKPPA